MYDVIVIGAGHAGCEAALASAMLGKNTLLVTGRLSTIGEMSCNPAIGGLAKGHLVKEIDALGGAMAQVADKSGIQFRRLNMSKGPAVRGTRCQSDRRLYSETMIARLNKQEGLKIHEGIVTDIIAKDNRATGVKTRASDIIEGKKIILTVGTFMNGLLHFGLNHQKAGRINDFSESQLSNSLIKLGIRLGRLKTGTVPRILNESIDFDSCEKQLSDIPNPKFSFEKIENNLPKRACYITHTNQLSHDIIKQNLSRSPLYSGKIKGIGPRYCPSIEDKICRFPDKAKHQLFLEPEGIKSNWIYVNGLPTSLPLDVQYKILKTIPALEFSQIVQPGYAVEYDFAFPTQLNASLESKIVNNLYFAGQINGTSGYEEAGAQGLMAGINSARSIDKLEPIILSRSNAYIGVLIDDLVTKGTNEPYRMFTSRAEHRLLLREDNADLRLTKLGRNIGLVNETKWKSFQKKSAEIEKGRKILNAKIIYPTKGMNEIIESLGTAKLKKPATLTEIITRPEISLKNAVNQFAPEILELTNESQEQLEIHAKYQGYINANMDLADKMTRLDDFKIPTKFNFNKIPNLSIEVREKLNDIKPVSLGQASRIPGVTPAAISILMIMLSKK